ncbi:MAG: FlgD immunoglobulin-like domain containing protein [Desulfobacterales bacterium]
MRITSKMMTGSITENLYRQAEQLLKSQKTVATGKRIQRASDDPVGLGKVLDYRRSLAGIEQYQQNVINGKMRLKTNETILDDGSALLNSAVNVAVNAASGPFDTRPTLAEEVRNLRRQLVQLANSKIGRNSLYAGHQTGVAPYSHRIEIAGGTPGTIEFGLAASATDVSIEIRDAAGTIVQTLAQGDGTTPGSGGTAGTNSIAWNGPAGEYSFTVTARSAGIPVVDYETYNGDSGDIRLIIGDRTNMVINADGDETFGDMFERLAQLQQALQNPDPVAGTSEALAAVDPLKKAAERLEHVRAKGAVMFKHLELTEDRYAGLKLNVEDMLEKVENVDMATAIVALQKIEADYQTTLATAARVLQPSLINFLR